MHDVGQLQGTGPVHRPGVGVQFDARVDGAKALRQGVDLRAADVRDPVHRAGEVCRLDEVGVDQGQPGDAGTHELLGGGRAQRPCPHHRHMHVAHPARAPSGSRPLAPVQKSVAGSTTARVAATGRSPPRGSTSTTSSPRPRESHTIISEGQAAHQQEREAAREAVRRAAAEAEERRPSRILATARALRLAPEAVGAHSWIANCPGTHHTLMLGTSTETFGCGYCKVKGGPEELESFVARRRDRHGRP